MRSNERLSIDIPLVFCETCSRLEFAGNVAIVLVGISAIARLGYYIMYGKEGGALALPKRSER